MVSDKSVFFLVDCRMPVDMLSTPLEQQAVDADSVESVAVSLLGES